MPLPTYKVVELADGLPVAVNAALRDEETLIYFDMFGPKQRVRANWAAIKAHRRRVFLFYSPIITDKGEHILIKSTLPGSEWENWIMLHRQASHKHAKPNQDFYLINPLDDENPGRTPANFYAMFSRVLPIPALPGWADYLWQQANHQDLLTPISERCHRLTGYRVSANPEAWSAIISNGISKGTIAF